MTRTGQLIPEFVEFIPERLAPEVLYISKRYSTASHLCCCGCGLEVVTPLNPAKWRLIENNGTVSLHPSIGNWSFPASPTTGSKEATWSGLVPCRRSGLRR